jgi:hypothetical protein
MAKKRKSATAHTQINKEGVGEGADRVVLPSQAKAKEGIRCVSTGRDSSAAARRRIFPVVERGSPRLPLIPESLILHHADDLDAKLEMYVRCLTTDKSAGPFTDRDPVLGRQLFKGREV